MEFFKATPQRAKRTVIIRLHVLGPACMVTLTDAVTLVPVFDTGIYRLGLAPALVKSARERAQEMGWDLRWYNKRTDAVPIEVKDDGDSW